MKIDLNDMSAIRYLKLIGFMSVLIGLKILGDMLYSGKALILPLALAVFLTYIIGPLIDYLRFKRFPKWLSVTLPILLTGLVFFFLGIIIKSNVESFVVEFPKYEARTTVLLKQVLTFVNISPETLDSSPKMWFNDPALSQYLDNFSLTKIISTVLGSISNLLSDIFLVLLFLLFMLSGRNTLVIKISKAFKPSTAERISQIIRNINQQIQKYIIAKTLISLLTSILVLIVLYSFDVKFALVWAILTFLLNFIPNVGSILATILPVSIAVIQFESFSPVLWLGGILLTIQTIVGNVIDPKYIGKSIDLSAIVVLFSLIFWGWLWGIIGMFLSVPIMVSIKITLENIPELRFLAILMSAEEDSIDLEQSKPIND